MGDVSKFQLIKGNIAKGLLLFMIPIFFASLMQSLYVACDAAVLGHFGGTAALSAIESVYTFTKLPLNFAIGVGGGISILISRYFGANSRKKLAKVVYVGYRIGLVIGLVLGVTFLLSSPLVLSLIQVPLQIRSLAQSYLFVYFLGLPITLMLNVSLGVMRAVGDSKTPFLFLLFSNILNLLLDLVLVGVFQLRVVGAAAATVGAQTLCLFFVMRKLKREGFVEISKLGERRKIRAEILELGLPIGFQGALYPVANMVISSRINLFGVVFIAAWGVCGKIDMLVWILADAFGLAVATFVAQNVGANQPERTRQGVWVAALISGLAVGLIGLSLYLFHRPLGTLILNDSEVLSVLSDIVYLIAPWYFLYALLEVFLGAVKGYGCTKTSMSIVLLGTSLFRILWILLYQTADFITMMTAYPFSWFVTSLASFVAFEVIRRRQFLELN